MKKVIKLTKIFLKNSFSNIDSRMGISTKSKSKIIIYGLLFLYFAGLIIFLGYNLLDGLIAIHQETIFVGMILFMIFGLTIVQTIFSSINVLYFTKDSEYLLPLPLKPYQIILARTNVMLIAEYLIIFLVGLIPLVMYGILTKAGIIYYFTMIFAVILIPILMVVVVYAGFNSDKMRLEQITQMLQQMPTNTFMIVCVILGVIQFFTMFIYISITAISRDGENAVFIKYIPVSLYKQYIYKIIPNIIMNIITVIITLGIAGYILHLPVITLIALFIIATIMGVFQSLVMIIVDLKRPKLNWDSEYAVVKQNLNLVFPVLLSMINIAIIVGTVFLLKDINVYLGTGILGILYIVLTAITNKYLYNKQYELANKII